MPSTPTPVESHHVVAVTWRAVRGRTLGHAVALTSGNGSEADRTAPAALCGLAPRHGWTLWSLTVDEVAESACPACARLYDDDAIGNARRQLASQP